MSTTKLAYSIPEACDATSLAKSTLYGHVADGRLKARRIGGRTLIMTEDLRAFLNSGEELAA